MKPEPQPIRVRDLSPGVEQFRQEVLDGLRHARKRIPCKYLYDKRGSELFEMICELDEYYPARTELAMMERYADEMTDALGPRIILIEYGSGSSRKTRLLLDRLDSPVAYVPIDISEEALSASARDLVLGYPDLEILPICADYTEPFEIPRLSHPDARRAVYFPGSTIGNFSHEEAREFLRRIGRVVGRGGELLIGVDLKKSPEVLEAAYDDGRRVTADFNMNMLARINSELGADFDLSRFHHSAVYNSVLGRVEMHLVSESAQTVTIGDERIRFDKGETIHTESSYKYDLKEFEEFARSSGFDVEKVWTDDRNLFSVQYLVVRSTEPSTAPA